MRPKLLFFALFHLVVGFALFAHVFPVSAQDAAPAPAQPPSPAPDVALIIAGAFIIIALISAHAYVEGKSVQALYRSAPPEFQGVVRSLLENLMQRAESTSTRLDDDALFQLADRLGYNKTQLSDGRIILSPRPVIDSSPSVD